MGHKLKPCEEKLAEFQENYWAKKMSGSKMTILTLVSFRNPGLPRVELFGLVFLGFLSSYSSSLILDLDSAAFRVELFRYNFYH